MQLGGFGDDVPPTTTPAEQAGVVLRLLGDGRRVGRHVRFRSRLRSTSSSRSALSKVSGSSRGSSTSVEGRGLDRLGQLVAGGGFLGRLGRRDGSAHVLAERSRLGGRRCRSDCGAARSAVAGASSTSRARQRPVLQPPAVQRLAAWRRSAVRRRPCRPRQCRDPGRQLEHRRRGRRRRIRLHLLDFQHQRRLDVVQRRRELRGRLRHGPGFEQRLGRGTVRGCPPRSAR